MENQTPKSKGREELVQVLQNLIFRRLAKDRPVHQIASWFDISISSVRRIKMQVDLNQFHPSRKRKRQVQKSGAFFKATKYLHCEAYSI